MNINKVVTNMNIKPTDRKIKQAKKVMKSILPKEMPIEKRIYVKSEADSFERIKDSIQVAVENMRNH